jgi:hypothetical protein
MKKYLILLISLFLVIGAVFVYFFTPLSAEMVFPETKKIEYINITGFRGDDGEYYSYESTPLEDSDKLKKLSSILTSVEYSRISKNVDILNPYQFIDILIFYNSKSGEIANFRIQVNCFWQVRNALNGN